MMSRSAQLLDGDEVVAEHQLDGHGAEQLVLDAEVLQVDEFRAIAARQQLGGGSFVLDVLQRELRVRYRPYGYPSPVGGLSQGEDGQIKRDENEDYDHAHEDQDGGLNERERRRECGRDIFLIKFGH